MIEVNALANIIQEIDGARGVGREIRVGLIRKWAWLGIGYLEAHDKQPDLKWHDWLGMAEREYDEVSFMADLKGKAHDGLA